MTNVKTKELQRMEERLDWNGFRQIDESKLSTGLRLDKEVNQS